tara:strand:+ start:1396 stop:2205 length:810 start_codon:yes stop_codon:yes gene_type:complete
MLNDPLYFCDLCYIDKIDEDDTNKRRYFTCYTNQQWAKHLKSKKHCIMKAKVEEGEDVVKCKKCTKSFTERGYEEHEKRNKKMWEMDDKMKCNNFTTGKHRFKSFDAMINFKLNKPTRTKVGKVSPITNSTRRPNITKNKTREYRKLEKIAEEKKKLEDEKYETCIKCNGAFNDTNYCDKEFVKKFNTILCECPDTPPASPINDIDNSVEELNVEIKQSIELTIEEIDMTEKPIFDEWCDCGKPINYDIPINIINKWDIETCECESDEE